MKRIFPIVIAASLLTGCGIADVESSHEETTKQTKAAYSIGLSDKCIIEEKDGDYVLVVTYGFENNSGKPQSFAWACQDSVFMDGIECEHTYDSYDLNKSVYVQNAEKGDKILDGKIAHVSVGYLLKDFKPDKSREITIQLSKALDSSDVFSETKLNTDDIRIIREKD